MPNPKPAVEEVSGYLGVGSLLLLGTFLIVDGLTGFYVVLAQYADASAFAILFAIPLLVISYVLGLVASLTVEALVQRLLKPSLSAALFAEVLALNKDPLTARYLEAERHSRMLYGCTLAFALLGIGSLLERNNMPAHFGSVGVLCFIVGLLLAAICPFLAKRIQAGVREHVDAAAQKPRGDA